MKYFNKQEDITPQNLNNLLKFQGFKTITALSIRKIALNGNTSLNRIVQLVYNQTIQGINPPSIFIKFTHQQMHPKAVQYVKNLNLFQQEVLAYEFAQINGFKSIPKIYYAYVHQGSNFTFIMEDLSVKYKIYSQQQSMDISIVKRIVKEMAKLHSISINKIDKFPSYPYLYEFFIKRRQVIYPNSTFQYKISNIKKFLQQNFTELEQKLKIANFEGTVFQKWDKILFQNFNQKAAGELFERVFYKISNQEKSRYCILHNDLRNENIFYNQNQIKFVDWQMICRGKPIWQFCYLVSLSLSLDQLLQNFKDLLNCYVENLQKQSGVKLSQEQINQSVEQFVGVLLELGGEVATRFKPEDFGTNFKHYINDFKDIQSALAIVIKIIAFFNNYKQLLK